MESKNVLADISRRFLRDQDVNQYRMKKVMDMIDDEAIAHCQFYCEENNLINEWKTYRENAESKYCYCSYMDQYVDEGFCYDLQMIAGGYIKASVLPEVKIDKVKCSGHCSTCEYSLLRSE